MPDTQIVQDTDPRCAELEAAGYRVVGESWAAHLSSPDRDLLETAVSRVTASGLIVRELGAEAAESLHQLEKLNERDYPVTPATERIVGELAKTQALWPEHRVFGAFDRSRLVGATVIRSRDGAGDTRFTSVLASYRRRGVGQAVKAASILAFLEIGITRFSTGGAAVNDGSLGANEALGYVVDERWRSYQL
ncbi:acetyltransferase [Kribbella antibiotica]|uniref:Acetyltransferase n=1 Tax=Kribbella antibiotica TaxID=190195 RepID=A0A4R4YIB3_9ACTN|nr:GNAT family N-acetyltransferase [Kribbella antibiotica]TDD44573.1 acetyltransferase [Kribbella antibiotica]